MKIQIKLKPRPRDGGTRVKKAFLFLPRLIGNEIRWLERAKWVEEYQWFLDGCDWTAKRWID